MQEKLNEREKKDDTFNQFNFDDDGNEYERLLRQLESDIRTYIKVTYILYKLF